MRRGPVLHATLTMKPMHRDVTMRMLRELLFPAMQALMARQSLLASLRAQVLSASMMQRVTPRWFE